MYKWLYRSAWVVAFAMLFHAIYFWGGVGLQPEVGERVINQSIKQLDALGVAFYAGTGRSIFGVVAPDSARNYAESQVGQVYERVKAEPFYSGSLVRDQLTGMTKFSHFGTPWAFIIAAIIYWRREKTIKSLGR